jgi:methylthioribose-1-phosphate isomerase
MSCSRTVNDLKGQQNAGALATVGYGTALAPIRNAIEKGKRISVISSETRPRLQGAKLTTFELMNDAIPVTLVTDNMIAYAMSKGLINKIIVGADRIVKDAVVNKIGTYAVAIIAKEFEIPFYVAAPVSTFDISLSSKAVKIEERDPKEVTHIMGKRIAPKGIKVMNPAFDITPLQLVNAIITEKGVIQNPTRKNLENALN